MHVPPVHVLGVLPSPIALVLLAHDTLVRLPVTRVPLVDDLGALPRDPLLVQALLEQAQRDPQLVARLVSEAKDARGQDVYARAAGGAVDYAAGAVASDEDADR